MKLFTASFLILFLCGCAAVEFKTEYSVMTGLFRINDAESVAFYSSANGFSKKEAIRNGSKWMVTLPKNGSFTYYLEKDGKLYIPECPMKQQDDFGGIVCVYEED